MPRPRKRRNVKCKPKTDYFKPARIPKRKLEEVNLTISEYEAIRLKDCENHSQKKAAKIMNISQPTFFRLLKSAREKISDSIVNGKAIKIEGGIYNLSEKKKKD